MNPRNFVDPNNLMRITAITGPDDSREAVLKRNPQYSQMSYYSQHGRKYKDLATYLKKFRCKNCKAFGCMAAVAMKNRPNIIESLYCTNCSHLASLTVPIDRNNLGNSMAVEHRPSLVGKATKFKQPLSETQKLGISRAARSNLPNLRNSKTFLLEDQYQDKSPSNSTMLNRHLRRNNFPLPSTHSVIKKNVDKDDDDFARMMSGKAIVKETVDYTPNDIRKRFSSMF